MVLNSLKASSACEFFTYPATTPFHETKFLTGIASKYSMPFTALSISMYPDTIAVHRTVSPFSSAFLNHSSAVLMSPEQANLETMAFQETEFLTGIARNTALASSTAPLFDSPDTMVFQDMTSMTRIDAKSLRAPSASPLVVQVSTSSSVTSKTIEEAFSAIPEDSRRKEYQDAVAKAQAEEETRASQRTRQAEEDTTTVKAGGKKTPSDEAAASEAQASLENLLSRAKGFGTDFSWEKLSTQLAAVATQDSDEVEPKAQIATVRGQAKAKKLAPQRAVVKPAAQKTRPTPKQPESKPDVRPVFGGLFKQETIFVDED
uniref:Uncharacterized protein n=1 Tax=Oryza nivara TaxID=4536 RepID=A0A0E0HY21_ORYNI